MTASPFFSFGFGVGTQNSKGEWLEVFYAQPLLNPAPSLIEAITDILSYQGGNQAVTFTGDKTAALATALQAAGEAEQAVLVASLADSQRPLVATFIEEDIDPKSVVEVYLKLHLLSHRLVKPHGTNLTGMFGLLPNVAWTN